MSEIAESRESEAKTEVDFAAIVELAPDGVVVTDENGAMIVANKRIEALFGYTSDELVGRHVEILMPERFRTDHVAHRTAYRRSPRIRELCVGLELYGQHKNGAEFRVDISLTPLPRDDGSVQVAATIRDITDQLTLADSIASSEVLFRTAFEAAPVGIATVDFADPVHRRLTNVNQALCDLLGYSREELLSKGFAELTHPEDSETSDRAAQDAVAGKVGQYGLEKRYLHRDGHPVWVWVHSAVVPEVADVPKHVLVHVADLSDRKLVEAERERSRAWIAGVAAIRRAALADEPLPDTLELICDQARRNTGADAVVVTYPDFERGVHRVEAADRPEARTMMPPEFGIDDPARHALAGSTFLTPRIAADDRIDPANRHLADDYGGMKSGMLVPIFIDDNVVALLVCASTAVNAFDERTVAEVEAFAAEASTAIRLQAARQAELDAAEAVRASEAAFRSAFDSAPVGMAIGSLEAAELRTITAANKALCDMLGYGQDELRSMSFSELTHPEDRDSSDAAAAREMQSGEHFVYTTDKRYVHRDGSTVWAAVHATALPDGDGGATSFLAHVVDITDNKRAEAERDRSRRRLEGLAAIRASVLSDDLVSDTLGLICWHTKDLIGADAAVIYESLDDETAQPVAFDGASTERFAPLEIELGTEASQIFAGRTFVSADIRVDPRVEDEQVDFAPDAPFVSVIAIPIAAPGAARTVLVLASGDADRFEGDDVALAREFADQASTALRLHQAHTNEARLRVLEDRERLAEDLHDLIIQRLFAAGMGLQAVQGGVTDTELRSRIGATVDQLDETIAELRSAIFGLNHPEAVGVRADIESVIEATVPALGFIPRLEIDGDPEAIPGATLEQLLPVIGEGLTNVARHAEATAAEVRVFVRDPITVTITDDGKGPNPDAAPGHGLRNLRSRAHRLNGSATLDNGPGGGAVLTWTAAMSAKTGD